MLKKFIRFKMGLLVTFLSFFKAAEGQETLRLALHEIPPMASEQLPDGGAYVKLVKEIFNKQNVDIKLHWYPMKRAFNRVKTGQADLALGWAKRPGRQLLFTYSDKPLAQAFIRFYHIKKSGFDWKKPDDLHGLIIGDRIGSHAGGKAYLAAEKKGLLNVVRVTTDEQNIKKLLSGRIDIMVGDSISMPVILKSSFSPDEREQITAHHLELRTIKGYAKLLRVCIPFFNTKFFHSASQSICIDSKELCSSVFT